MAGGREFWNEMSALGNEHSFAQGDHLLRWDDGAGGRLLAIRHGVCKVVNSTGDGRESMVAVRGPGEVVGELSALMGTHRSASVVALTPVRAAVIRLESFDRWLDNEVGAGRHLATMLAERIVESTRPGITAHQRVESRLADRVLVLRDRFGVSERIAAPLTHDDFAAWIGRDACGHDAGIRRVARTGLSRLRPRVDRGARLRAVGVDRPRSLTLSRERP